MKILTFSTLYPNAQAPGHGIFVETRLRKLLADFENVTAQVVAPVPWFPFRGEMFGEYGKFARIEKSESRHGIRILHPRFLHIPRFGMAPSPYLMAYSCLPVLRNLLSNGFNFDLIDAHYYFPDGVAASLLGQWLDKPVVVTARGTDINLIPNFTLPRRLILQAARRNAATITVSASLKQRMVAIGAAPEKIHVLRNGVDLTLFQPIDRDAARTALGWKSKVLLSVGNLLELKGHHLIIDAMRELGEFRLIIIGSGKEESSLRKRCIESGVEGRVELISRLPQNQLNTYYGAADALILASSREGWANVLLESMACGTPVVATAVGGNPEVVADPAAGILLPERSTPSIVEGVKQLFSRYPDRNATRRYAEQFDWRKISEMQVELFQSILARDNRKARV